MTTDILHTLDTDPQARAAFVEALRASAAQLTGTSTITLDDETRRMVRAQLADRLLSVAQRLCEHARVENDGRCRYCRAEAPLDG